MHTLLIIFGLLRAPHHVTGQTMRRAVEGLWLVETRDGFTVVRLRDGVAYGPGEGHFDGGVTELRMRVAWRSGTVDLGDAASYVVPGRRFVGGALVFSRRAGAFTRIGTDGMQRGDDSPYRARRIASY